MRLRKWWHGAGSLAAGILLLTASCSGPTEPVIGAIVPETGSAAPYGKAVREGMDLALEEINAGGGVDGQPLAIFYEDSGSDPAQGKAAARRLIEERHVPIIIGAVSSSVTLTVLEEVAEPAGVPLLSPASSSPNLTGKSPFFARVYPSDALEGARMADLISDELRLKRLVVFAVMDEYGVGYKRILIERYRRGKNREVLKVFNYNPGDTDFSALMDETRELGPDAIFLVGYMNSLAPLAQQVRAAGIEVPLFCSGSITSEFPAMAGEAAEGMIFSRSSPRVIGDPERYQKFEAAYTARFGREPEDYAAYGYDAVKLVAQVMQGGGRTARDVHLALRSPASLYEGVTGTIVFGNEGDVVASPTTYIIHGGSLLLYKDYLEQGGAPPGAAADAA